jgi:hypothetical protein
MKITPLKAYKAGFRKGLCVAYRLESKSPVEGILAEETEKHARVKLKTANGTIRTYEMKNVDVLPTNHPLSVEYYADARKFEIEENERRARQRDEEYKTSLQAFVSKSIIQAKNEMTEAVQKLLPPLLPPQPKKKATPAPASPEIPETLADNSQPSTQAMIAATVAEALKVALPRNRSPSRSYRHAERADARRSASRSPSPRRRSPEQKPSRSYRHAERPDARRSASRSPSPRRRSPEQKPSRSYRHAERADARRSASRSPSPRRRSPEYKPSRSYRHAERPDARRSAYSPDSSPSPESGSRKRSSLQYSPNSSRDSKFGDAEFHRLVLLKNSANYKL